ncbi:transposase [Listeria cornellensis FSL F6-0969]|uniref:Transposase n=2 Tax=Listeria cornellensis TaxID=1494961 RepID=W7C6R9_9LIST|nr:transposase [Listeria cornellensis FSL F6-0969]
MCRILGVSRSTYYYQARPKNSEAALEQAVVEEFHKSRQNYGTRKLKVALALGGFTVSRRKIAWIMRKFGLISNYTKASYKGHKTVVNEAPIRNQLERQFKQEQALKVIVTDLTYVRVANKWHYVCFILDLFNREIIGHSAGPHKTAALVKEAIYHIPFPLTDVQMFHTDRGSEFDNREIDEILASFEIQRSLSKKGCPYDNAVAESTYKSFKKEFVYPNQFQTLEQLQVQLFDYVNWWNHIRFHGTLNYQSPVSFRIAKSIENKDITG